MEFIPAIDILGGKCVRLRQGKYDDVTSYGDDPGQVAVRFTEAGARRIHVVDLDAARGAGDNRSVIRRLRSLVSCTVEVGGGIRTETDVRALLDVGVDRLVIGTTLARNPEEVARWVADHGPVLIAGIDARDGQVKIAGWERGTGMSDRDLARKAAEIGVISIIYTNIAVDGMMSGPDLERTAAIADASGLPVIISGGVGSMADVERVSAQAHPGIVGMISGKAVYEGRIDVADAVNLCRSRPARQARPEGDVRW